MEAFKILQVVILMASLAMLCEVDAFSKSRELVAEDICLLPPDVGPCDGVYPRWYYNAEEFICMQFIYGGCDGNDNNFETFEECMATCAL